MKKVLNWLYDYPELKVYQYESGFKFSLDSILLAEYVHLRKSDEAIIDLCTGNGVIPLLLATKYQKKIMGVEIQEEIYKLACESVAYNGLDDKVSILHEDVRELKKYFPGNNFDVVVSNPPYFKYHSKRFVNNEAMKMIARHEVKLSLEELIEVASFLLKTKGRFFLVHIPERVDEICVFAHRYHMALKRMQFVTSKDGEEPILVLAELVKDGKFGCKVAPFVSVEHCESYQGLFS